MNTAADLHRAVQNVLASRRLGTPVFVRYLFHARGPHPQERLAKVVGTIREWFGQPIERVYALGSLKDRHVSLTLEFRGAATAQITWAGTSGNGIDLMVVGNHGAIYHDLGAANDWDAIEVPTIDPADQELSGWIERALRSGRPETNAAEARP